MSGVGSSSARGTCETSQVPLAGVPGGFSRCSTVFATNGVCCGWVRLTLHLMEAMG